MEDKTRYLIDAATSASLGFAAAAARHAMATHKMKWSEVIGRTFAAMVVAVFAGFAADSLVEAESLRYAIVGGVSYAAPEVLSWLIKFVNFKGEKLSK
jgi:fructose-specific phosphotransferase system IIC component